MLGLCYCPLVADNTIFKFIYWVAHEDSAIFTDPLFLQEDLERNSCFFVFKIYQLVCELTKAKQLSIANV